MAGRSTIRWRVLAVACVATGVLAWAGQHRLRVDTDITSAVPTGTVAFASARQVLARHPALDRLVVNLSFRDGHADTEALIAAGDLVVTELERSGLFASVGTGAAARGITALYANVPSQLPLLFSREDLQREVAPRLEPAAVSARLAALAADVSDLAGIGAAARVAEDPLGLGEIALARLGDLVPSQQGRIERGHILDVDGKNLLIAATPRDVTRDTRASHAIDDAISAVARRFQSAKPGEVGADIMLTPVGGYRAAIDNETLVTRDANLAMLASTIGIALLLLACFPRPWLGVFALLPALAGGCLALFVYSLIESDISALALGFGGALVSITVDQGAVYLLFVDRKTKTAGHRAAREVFSIGSLSTLINIGSFLSLRLTGFRVLGQIGLFAALGIGFSYLFVHLVFPHIFPAVPAASRSAWVPIDRWLGRITVGRGFRALAIVAALFAVALVFARPRFVVDLAAMNTVRAETARDEARIRAVWGDIFHRVYVLIDAQNDADFRQKSDTWLALVQAQKAAGAVEHAFSPSMLSPGPTVAAQHGLAWKEFWTNSRVAGIAAALRDGAAQAGFSPNAFAPFLARLTAPAVAVSPLSEGVRALYGVGPGRDGKGVVWLGTVVPGPRYAPLAFAEEAHKAGLFVFDGDSFSQTLADLLARSFRSMFVVVVCFVAGSVLLFFLDLRVVAIALAPMTFSFVMTLATLHLIGRPIDIVGLILSVLIFGMGVDYSFSFVRVYQRCLDENHPSHAPVRLSIFLSASATLIGMGTMTTAKHAVTRSAGIMATLAIGTCALGAYVLLPPVLRLLYRVRPLEPRDRARPERWVMRRFRGLSAYPRMFAWFKMRLDPMFRRLGDFIPDEGTILDIGCGFGVAAAWMLARSERLRVVAVEPDEDRVVTARFVLADCGVVHEGGAPEALPQTDAAVVTCLDVVHHLDDQGLAATLSRARACLSPGGKLVLRTTVPAPGRAQYYRWYETRRLHMRGLTPHYRDRETMVQAMTAVGLRVVLVEPTAPGREETWFIAEMADGRRAAGEA
jgi:predicted exporter/2-polyprenyl-3-methyl-5-hydroxy-6-metoxy-1,4-benzoquinol methylase